MLLLFRNNNRKIYKGKKAMINNQLRFKIMANSDYNLKYTPLTGKDSWNPKAYVSDRENAEKIADLDLSTEDGLKGLESFLGPVVLNIDEDQANRAKKIFQGQLDAGSTDYIVSNIGKVAKYVGEPNVLPAILNFTPTDKRKAEGDKALSDEDKKYNAAAEAIENFRKTAKETRANPRKALDDELKGINEISKRFWLQTLGEQGLLDYRIQKVQGAAVKAINEYGTAKYLTESVKIAHSKEREYDEKASKIDEETKSTLQARRKALGGQTLTTQEAAQIRKPFQEKRSRLSEQYAQYIGVANAVVNNKQAGLSELVLSKYARDEAETNAVKELMEATYKKTGKKLTEGEAREMLGLL
jgi:hypothetical protein